MLTTKQALHRIASQVPPALERGTVVRVNRLSGTVDVRVGASRTARKNIPITDSLKVTQVGLGASCVVTRGQSPVVMGIDSAGATRKVTFASNATQVPAIPEPNTLPGATMQPAPEPGLAGRYVQKLPTGYAENTIQASGAAQALRLVGNVSDQNILEIMTGEMGYPVRLYVDRDGHFWVSDDGHIRGSQLDISNSSIRVYNQDKTQYRELTVAGLSEVQNA